MKSIAEIFDNSKELLDSISNFVDKYIGASLLRRCNITKIVDSVTENTAYEYVYHPLMRLVGKVQESKFLEKCVSARPLLLDKILAGFAAQTHIVCLRWAASSGTIKRIPFTAST